MALGWETTKTKHFQMSRLVNDMKMHSGSEEYRYVGYFREKEGGKVIRSNFTKNYAKSVVEYNAMWKSRKYESGVMGHTGIRNFWQWRSKWAASGKNRQQDRDCAVLPIIWAQETFGLYKSAGGWDKQEPHWISQADLAKKVQEDMTKIKALYKGKGDRLNKAEYIFAITYDKRYSKFSHVHWASKYSMKNAYTQISSLLANNWLKKKYVKDLAWLISSREYGPFECSEEKFTDKSC